MKAQRKSTVAKVAPEVVSNALAALVDQVVKADKPAKAKPAKTRGVKPTGKLVIGKWFKPRTNHVVLEATDQGKNPQMSNWDAMVDVMNDNKGGATFEQLVEALDKAAEKGGYTATANSYRFVAARLRKGHLELAI